MLPGKKFTPEDLVGIGWKHKWLILVPFVVVAAATFAVSSFLPNVYFSQTLIQVIPQRVPESYVRSTVTAKIEDRLQSLSQQIMSRTRLEKIIQEFGLYAKEREKGIMEDVVEQMRKDITVDIGRESDAFRLGYKASDARTAMRVTERLATLFIDENLRDRGVLADATSQFLQAQLDDARKRLEEQEAKLEAFRKRYSGELPSQMQSNMQAIQNTQLQIQALVESTNRDRDRRLMLQRLHSDLLTEISATPPPAPVIVTNDPTGAAVELSASQQLENARAALRQLELRLKPEHPDILRTKRAIKDLERKAQEEEAQRPLSPAGPEFTKAATPLEAQRQDRVRQMEAEMESLDRQVAFKEAEEKRLRSQVSSYQARVDAVPGLESEWIALSRDYDTLQKAYQELLAKSEDSKVAANLERRQIGEQFRILDPANLPERPVSPNRMQINASGAGAGLLIGLLLIGLVIYKDNSLRTEPDVLSVLALPVLAIVPRVTTAMERQRLKRRRLVASLAVASVVLLGAAGAVWKLQLWKLMS